MKLKTRDSYHSLVEHERNPTIETIALWRRHGWKSLFEEKARKLGLSVEHTSCALLST
jgi:hypothetical protein